MADNKARVEALKVTASDYRSRIELAASKKEAQALAVKVVETLLEAVKLSSNADEKRALRVQFDTAFERAHHIKSTPWVAKAQTPTPQSQPLVQRPKTKSEEIGSWVANVVNVAQPVPPFGDNAFQTGSSSTILVSSAIAPKSVPKDNLHTGDLISGNQRPEASLFPSIRARDAQEPAPARASSSQPNRLVEPRSIRKRTTKEDIILLKASYVNGFKFPPWEKFPTPSEFTVGDELSLFVDTPELSLSTYQQQCLPTWARPEQAIPPPSWVSGDRDELAPVMSTSRSIDLVQDAATDCSVVASLCAGIARAERGYGQIISDKLYPFDKNTGKPAISPNGKYIVRLNFNGCWRKVVIDDRLPLSGTHRVVHVVDRRQPALLWPALMEKAYLKVRGGYDFPGSNSCSDLWIMTGWVPEQIHLQGTDTVPDELWDRIYRQFIDGNVLVTLGTGKMSSRHEQELGLEGQHSYVVLDMRKTDDERLLLVKNPWAEGRGWRGPRPSVEPLLDASTPNAVTNSVEVYHQDSLPSTKRPHPTTFYIALEHVIQHFESLYLNWNPVLFQYRQDIHFDWEIDELKGENTCIVSQPQFSFWSKDEKEVWFLLTRHFRETCMNIKDESDAFNDGSIRPDVPVYSAEDAVMGYMSIYVCTGNGQRIYIKDTYLESSDYVTTPQCLLRWDTDADSRYTVVVDQENLPPSKYTFTLSAFSNSEMTLDPAANKYPFQKILAGEWMKETAGGSTTSTMYLDNPQFSLEVKNSGPLAILLTGADKKSLLHVKLAIGYGKRMHRLQTRDVLVDSGDHRPGCVFAEMEDVSPGRYTIICSLFEPGQTGEFTLRVDSTSDVVLKEIAREGAGMFYRKLSPVCFGPGVNKIAAPLVLHRLASYTIIARFQQAMISHSLEQPLGHSPFRFSIERGRGPESSFLIASEGGNYTSTAMARTEAVDMDPCLYKTGDLWLVFDRLSSSSAAVEWYDIEMYHDVPGACSVGVWRNWDT